MDTNLNERLDRHRDVARDYATRLRQEDKEGIVISTRMTPEERRIMKNECEKKRKASETPEERDARLAARREKERAAERTRMEDPEYRKAFNERKRLGQAALRAKKKSTAV